MFVRSFSGIRQGNVRFVGESWKIGGVFFAHSIERVMDADISPLSRIGKSGFQVCAFRGGVNCLLR